MTQMPNERSTREQQFLMLVQTGAIIKELSVKRTDRTALLVLGAAMEVFKYVPKQMDVLEAATQFIEYMFSEESVPTKPHWVINSGL